MDWPGLSQASLSDGCPTYGGSYKVLSDPVHKNIILDERVVAIVDTPEFQRLRDLKQLGTAYYVFPGAAHNRFEHSIGVSWLSGQLIDTLALAQPELEITDKEKTWVRIAGAVHDLGHGPFSHVFDNMFIPVARPEAAGWSHEVMSMQLLDYLLDENSIDILDDDGQYGRDVVKHMVFGAKPGDTKGDEAGYRPKPIRLMEEKPYLFQIVANGITGIDTDKFDYLARDTYNLGMTSAFDHKRLLYSARIIRGNICYHAKEVLSVYTLFHTRYMLFKQIYMHRATKSIEFMLTDILLEADRAWGRRLSRAIESPAEYAELTDCILRDVEISKDPSLARAREIIKGLRTRKLYRFVDEWLVPLDLAAKLPKLKAADIASCNKDPSVTLHPDDIIVHDVKFNYGKGEQNPVDYCRFYRDASDEQSFRIPRDKVSHLLPQHFQERVVRIYSRTRDQYAIAAIQKAFRWYLKKFKSDVSMEPDVASRVWSQMPLPEYLAHSAAVVSPSVVADGADADERKRARDDDDDPHTLPAAAATSATYSPTGYRRALAPSIPTAVSLSQSSRAVPAPAVAVHAPLRKPMSPMPRVRKLPRPADDVHDMPGTSASQQVDLTQPVAEDAGAMHGSTTGAATAPLPAIPEDNPTAVYALPGAALPDDDEHDDVCPKPPSITASRADSQGSLPSSSQARAGTKRSAPEPAAGNTIHAYFGGSQRSVSSRSTSK